MEKREPNKDEMITNMDKAVNELEDEVLEAVAGGTGEDDWESFECVILFSPRSEEFELQMSRVREILSEKYFFAHYEMYRLEDGSYFGTNEYKFVITLANHKEETYNEFYHWVYNTTSAIVFKKNKLYTF